MIDYRLAPLALEPRLVPVIWGGHKLVTEFGKPGDPTEKIGESWECWDENPIAPGPYSGALAGKKLADARAALGAQLLGTLDSARPFPILTKFIDARQSLSVQVHPTDAYARRVEGALNGKTECWYVLEAEADAHLVLGWTRDTSRGEYEERLAAGTLEELLRRVPVHPGDVFHLPAGLLHAIGHGVVLYETQQTSDLTYRIYDYGRIGADGKPRRLNVEKAADVLDYHAAVRGAIEPLRYALDGLRRSTLVVDPNFILERVEATATPGGLDLEGLPLVVTALAAAVEIEAHGCAVALEPYQTVVVPAALDVVMLRAFGDAAAVLTAAPPAGADAAAKRFARAAVPVGRSTDFLAQFAAAG